MNAFKVVAQDQEVDPARRRLVILIPGYQEVLLPGAQLADLKNQIVGTHQDIVVRSIARETFSGYELKVGAKTVEMFEASWQSSAPMLSAKGWATKLSWGALLLLAWLKPRVLINARKHCGWYFWFAAMFAMMLIWWYGTISLLLSAANPSLFMGFWNPQAAGHAMQSWAVWVFISSALAGLGVSITASVDVADLFRRYLDNSKDDNGLQTRTVVRGVVTNAIDTLSDKCDELVLVGHSFGVLVGLDAIAEKLVRTAQFISLGGFLSFLSTETSWVRSQINKSLAAEKLLTWQDYYSNEDIFAGPSPVPVGTAKFTPHPIKLNSSISQRLLGKTHTMYFRNEEVQAAIAAFK